MNVNARSFFLCAIFFSGTLLAQAAANQDSETLTPSARSIIVELVEGQLLSIIEPRVRDTPEARAALETYNREAISMAEESGYVNHGALRVTETLVGNDDPRLFVLVSWPSEEADLSFAAQPEFQPYKAMRPIIWDVLRFYKAETDSETVLHFREDKHYTIALAWHGQTAPNDYRDYLGSVTSAVEALGGRFIHTLFEPRYVSHDMPPPGPNEINIVEWDTKESLDEFRTSEIFLEHYDKLHSGTTRFELYRIKPILN